MNTTKTTRPGFWLRAIEYRKHELLHEERRAFRDTLADRARDGISDEDYATTMATLEKMARNLGWDDNEEMPRSRHGFGPFGHGHPFHEDHPRRRRPKGGRKKNVEGTEKSEA